MGLQASSRKKSLSQKQRTIIWLGNCSTKGCVQELGNRLCEESRSLGGVVPKLSPLPSHLHQSPFWGGRHPAFPFNASAAPTQLLS